MTLNYRIKKLALELLRKSKVSNLSPAADGLTLGLYNNCLNYTVSHKWNRRRSGK
jgi:hypothetical protein